MARGAWLSGELRAATLLVVVSLLITMRSSCGREHDESSSAPRSLVIGGRDTEQDRFSFAEVSIRGKDGGHECGGSLVAPDIVLTAAHCQIRRVEEGEGTEGREGREGTVHIHRHNFDSEMDEFEIGNIASIERHPQFDPVSFRYDFAIVFLAEPVLDAQPIRLNDDPDIPGVGDIVSVLGWGATDISNPYQPIYPSALQHASLRYISNDRCESTKGASGYPEVYRGEIFDEMMCASAPNVDACSGDSGHSLILSGETEGSDLQVGIVSWGRGCAVHPGVYSRISAGFDWIRDTTCSLSQDPPAYLECFGREKEPEFIEDPDPVKQKAPGLSVGAGGTSSGLSVSGGATSSGLIDVIIQIQLDGKSGDTGWALADSNGTRLASAEAGTYTQQYNGLVFETVQVEEGSKLILIMIDTSGDGICCGHGVDGWYRVVLSDNDGNFLDVVEENGSFGQLDMHSFIATLSPPSEKDASLTTKPSTGSLSFEPDIESSCSRTRSFPALLSVLLLVALLHQ